jgi:hypothetical protein
MKQKDYDVFFDEEDIKYFFTASGGTQTIRLCSETDKNVLFEIDYKNAYKMLDYLDAAINFLDTDEE